MLVHKEEGNKDIKEDETGWCDATVRSCIQVQPSECCPRHVVSVDCWFHKNACMAFHSIVTKYVLIFFFYALLLLMIRVGVEARSRNEETELKKQPILSTLAASRMSHAVQNNIASRTASSRLITG